MNYLEIAKSTVEYVGGAYRAAQYLRMNIFLKGCKKRLEEKGELSGNDERDLKGIFESEYGKEKMYDFVRKALESNSKIGRLAIARLFVDYRSKPVPHTSYDENILLKALTELDDADANMLLCVLRFKSPTMKIDCYELDKYPHGFLELSSEEWPIVSTKLVDYGITSPEELRARMEQFAVSRVFSSTAGLLGTESGDIFRLNGNSRSQEFIDCLDWSSNLCETL